MAALVSLCEPGHMTCIKALVQMRADARGALQPALNTGNHAQLWNPVANFRLLPSSLPGTSNRTLGVSITFTIDRFKSPSNASCSADSLINLISSARRGMILRDERLPNC